MSPTISAARRAGINNSLAVREIYGKERSPFKAIPQSNRGPGQLTGGHHVTLQAWTVQLQVTALLGEAGGKLTAGYGAWEQVAVPRNQALTQWTGQTLLGMDLDLLFDGWGAQRSVEGDLAKLVKLATRQPGMLTPPSLRIFGATPAPATRWVITGLTWGDALRSFRTGQRLRQAVTVQLLQYREETDLIALPRAKAAAKPPRKYKVKRGDDLKKIAARMLGKSSRWQQIAKANKGMRGFKLGASWVGKTIKVPPR